MTSSVMWPRMLETCAIATSSIVFVEITPSGISLLPYISASLALSQLDDKQINIPRV